MAKRKSAPIPIPVSQSSSYQFPMYNSPPVTPPDSVLRRAHRFVQQQIDKGNQHDNEPGYWDRQQWSDGPVWAPFWPTPPGTPPLGSAASPREELLSDEEEEEDGAATVTTTRYMSEMGDEDDTRKNKNTAREERVQWMSTRSFSGPSKL